MTLTDGKNNLSKDDIDLIKESNEMSNKVIKLLRKQHIKQYLKNERKQAIDRLMEKDINTTKTNEELIRLYNILEHLSLKPEYGGNESNEPEKRKAIMNRIKEIEGKEEN